MRRLFECALVFVLAMPVTARAQLGSDAGGDAGGNATPFPAGVPVSPASAATTSGSVEASAVPRCDARVASAMFTDDPYNTPDEIAAQWRTLGLPQPHAIAHRQAEAGGCFDMFSPDPLLLALPGAPLPDVIVRVRPAKLAINEPTMNDKIDAGIRGYIESYTTWLGAKSTTEGPPLLREAGVRMSLLCPRSRRVVREFDVVDTRANEALVQQNENTASRQNAARVERALAQAFTDMLALVRARPCDIAASAASPALPSLPAPPSSPMSPSSQISQPVTPYAASRNESLPLKSAVELPAMAATASAAVRAEPMMKPRAAQ